MRSPRRTISLPPALAARLDREAERRQMSFSSVIAELASDHPEPLPYAGLADDDGDLSQRIEEVLARLADRDDPDCRTVALGQESELPDP